ncbi:MAG: alpha-glucosidase/alpha-galactosidase [Clostridia bacterium]|nr:alpha-glucosidase/alpha-galactosidase [Clostridia bacterium]
MKYTERGAEEVKIAYIGGGSRGWAWGLMSDLAENADMFGDVYLYDIDYEAAQHNEIIGNKFNDLKESKSTWNYKAVKTIDEALTGADFVVVSILPGTFDEMESDVHTPEKYGIYQSVGDSTGPGGVIRALRTMPMMEEIALAVKKNCPKAWVINYTNPMALCVKAMYDAFPEIKAFGCCHEVFGAQAIIAAALLDFEGVEVRDRKDIKVDVIGVNHFTWITKAHYKNRDVFPLYAKYAEKYMDIGVQKKDDNWFNYVFDCSQRVKFDLYKKYGYFAAAGDRHLAEFCPGKWYLESPERVKEMGFGLTAVSWRKSDLQNRLARSKRLLSGEEQVKIENTGEDGVNQMRALLGLCPLISNINIPNVGQIRNLPLGAIVETNAIFVDDDVTPVFAGDLPQGVYSLVARNVDNQLLIARSHKEKDLKYAFEAFCADPLTTCNPADAKKLFDEMIDNTKHYLGRYFK